ncbi:hypothetical protein PSPO01_15780 [Paraphaeosphaeria sporulosa]
MPRIFEPATGPNGVLAQYLAKLSPDFVQLEAVRKRIWEDPEGDTYWQNRRERVDTATEDTAKAFYEMTKQIAEEMQAKTSGFTWATLKYNSDAVALGITLPSKNGGYRNCLTLPGEHVKFMDITMLAREFGIETVPRCHPDHSLFLAERPFVDQRFQLIFCGGAVLRGHERADYRQNSERTRLTTSQLILAMQRIVPGGTMVVLLRKPENWDVLRLLHQFSSFADIQLFKPQKKHAVRSTFYLVANNVQPDVESAKAALDEWKKNWSRATFGDIGRTGENAREVDAETVQEIVGKFGQKLIELATPL